MQIFSFFILLTIPFLLLIYIKLESDQERCVWAFFALILDLLIIAQFVTHVSTQEMKDVIAKAPMPTNNVGT